jgi:TonB family protein
MRSDGTFFYTFDPSSSPPVHDVVETRVVSDAPRERVHAGESLVVLTRDSALVETLKSLGSQHHIASVATESDLATQLMSDQTGVAVIDAAALSTPVARLTERLKSQFPDLVLIVAGMQDHQSALAAQITTGTVYRFLHKPVSEQRVRLFVDAAWRRHGQERSGVAESLAATGVIPEEQAGLPRGALVGGGVVVAALLVFGGWSLTHRPNVAGTPNTSAGASPAVARDEVLEDLLSRADKAFAAGSLLVPTGASAADLYRQAVSHNGSDPRPAAGLEKVIGKLLSAAERQLAARHLDEAQRLIDQARALKPDHVRVAFLATQIGKERERALLAQARQAATSGNIEGAIAVLDSATREDKHSSPVTEARAELEQKKLDRSVSDYLAKAAERLAGGQLVEPAEDNARFFIESARAIAPNEPAVQQAQQQLDDTLVGEARKALTAGNAAQAQRWIDAAADSGVSPDDIAELTRAAQRVQADAKAEALARLAQLFNQSLTQGRIDDPPNDCAKFYLAQLVQSDATHPSTVLARQALAKRVLDEAKAAAQRQDYNGAHRWLAEAHDAGADDTDIAAVEHDMTAAQDSAKRASEVVQAGNLELQHYTPPAFPITAREQGLSGWVEVQFLVTADGSVADPVIMGAEPVGIFEQAALEAIRKWHYKPILRDGQAVDQRARLRMKFALDK